MGPRLLLCELELFFGFFNFSTQTSIKLVIHTLTSHHNFESLHVPSLGYESLQGYDS